MKILVYFPLVLSIIVFALNDIQIIYGNSILFPDYSYITVALYYLPKGLWNQAYIPFPAFFILIINSLIATNPLVVLSIFYILFKYIYVFTYWLILKRIKEVKVMMFFVYWFLVSTLLLLHDKFLLYTVPYNIVLLLLSYFYSNSIITNKLENSKKIIYITALTSTFITIVYVIIKNYLYSIFSGLLLFIILIRLCRINNLKESWSLIFSSFSYPIIVIPLLSITILSLFFKKLNRRIVFVSIVVSTAVGFYNYYAKTSLLNFNYAIFAFSPYVFHFINQYLQFVFVFISLFIYVLSKNILEFNSINLLFFFILPMTIPTEYTYRYLHFVLLMLPATVVYLARFNYIITKVLLAIATIMSIFILTSAMHSIINIDIYFDFKHHSGVGELANAEISAAQQISSIIKTLPLHKIESYTVYGTYIDYVRDCYIVSDPYTSFLLASITRCRTYFDPVFVIPNEYPAEQRYKMELIRIMLTNISNFMSLLNQKTSNYIYIIVISNRTAYYLKNNNCYFVFLDKSPHMYATGNCYMSQPFNIPNNVVNSILNLNFTKYIIDKQNYQVYYITFTFNSSK